MPKYLLSSCYIQNPVKFWDDAEISYEFCSQEFIVYKADKELGVTNQIIMRKVRDKNKILWKQRAGMIHPLWNQWRLSVSSSV